MTRDTAKPSLREAKRRETRQRVLDAAITEFKRAGMADADVGVIIRSAGVAHGTFYFHFPTKEHVLFELERQAEETAGRELAAFLQTPHTLEEALNEVVRVIVAVEQRLGRLLFKDVLALHFSSNRPLDDEWTDHRVIVLVVHEIERARQAGEADADVDAFHSAVYFLLSLYALLTTSRGADQVRTALLDNFVHTALRGIAAR
ncbi:TetR/AcrR family transcriptional regulator [Mycolicibacterium phocaicum]|uniref:TetR family transcriptional regulator n=1 Tax=Mycolicibacterium phocaicum TaxID=319706 RepID=A0A7I7ZZK8_9MYCO|nr:TetR/AcrR family transcriptional regulator [Mycolicibacterium phocaicum]TLH64369.1 TetR family transcriptional regulator [Mycolicibacterium phocaicum]BBZ58271.1 TetR family transcriptional regulator [Mycolicibacterium phocaicum]